MYALIMNKSTIRVRILLKSSQSFFSAKMKFEKNKIKPDRVYLINENRFPFWENAIPQMRQLFTCSQRMTGSLLGFDCDGKNQK